MSLLRTLSCAHGQDSPVRLVAIQAGILVVLLVMAGLFYSTSFAYSGSALVVLVLTPFAWLSGVRRLHQAGRPKGLAWLLAAAWVLVAIALIFVSSFSWWTLILPVAATVALALLPSKATSAAGHWGYVGPMNHSNSALARSRVEPSLAGETETAALTHDWDERPSSKISLPAIDFSHASELLKRRWLPLSAASCVAIVAVVAIAGFGDDSETVVTENKPSEVESSKPESAYTEPQFDAVVSLPDSFQVALQQQSLVISWPGDPAAKGELWSQLRARGDKTCAVAEFNNGDTFRPISVEVMADDIYYANFSALDTKAVVYNVAMRGNFTLCGYRFSLSGTMKPLKAEPAFARYVSK